MLYRVLFSLLFLQSALAAWALPTGDFQVGESDGDDFQQVLRLEGDQAVFQRSSNRDSSGTTPLKMTISNIGPDLYQLVGAEHGETLRAYLRFSSSDEALLWFSGQSRLFWVVRDARIDTSVLRGPWFALVGQDVWEVEIGDDGFVLDRNGQKVHWTVQTVAGGSGGEIRAVARPDNGEASLLSFLPLSPDLWLVRNHEQDRFIMLYRESSKAMMEAERDLRTKSGPDESEREDD